MNTAPAQSLNHPPAVTLARSGFYRFISDPGHGWLRVPVDRLIALGIADRISAYSYWDPTSRMAWLEEDCDVAVFLSALHPVADDASVDWWRAHVKEVSTDRDSFVRGLPRFVASAVQS